MGVSEAGGNLINEGNVYGTYIHGFFDREEIAETVAKEIMKSKGLDFSSVIAYDIDEYKQQQYDILAEGLRKSLDMDLLKNIIG